MTLKECLELNPGIDTVVKDINYTPLMHLPTGKDEFGMMKEYEEVEVEETSCDENGMVVVLNMEVK